MAIQPEPIRMTLGEFLEWEPRQPLKYEFFEGLIFSMAGASRAHGQIAANLLSLIRPAIRGSGCGVYVADMKVATESGPSVRYPDLVLTCDPRDLADDHVTRYPKLLVEIISLSTASVDRVAKFNEYRTIPTLREYALIDSAHVHVAIHRRNERGLWSLQDYYSGDSVSFETVPLDVPIEALYEDLKLGPAYRSVVQ